MRFNFLDMLEFEIDWKAVAAISAAIMITAIK